MGWLGISEFESALKKVAAQADDASKIIVAKSAAVVVKEAMSNFEGTRKRIMGPRAEKYGHLVADRHVGGDKPNVISGDLRRSIKADPITRFGFTEYGTKVAPRMAYGRRVELGLNGSKGYPFFEPGVLNARPLLAAIARDAWAEIVRL
ncbi:hypothetical protein [Cryobacterium sp. GrIS_2_6]|uniref:hypothetical protein n=1 Tax=Cryobacterium sp. GrIS_2_6 TaxID=3162785 RepID=UPI002E00ED38|nr:hypothetical protein [Cryobacterium psychrotolerans]MEC5149221.1 hypothetical protein [Cryobacterium psychrotolerans]MEC5149302.1 hypothetical protein [Cryobacterium psychrotolerans]